jgi:hypothetical protein
LIRVIFFSFAKYYKLQNPHLTASYALPPQTSFISAPYSVYRKGSSRRSPHRHTYAFVAEDTPSAKSQLVCFTEETHNDSTTDIVRTAYSPSISCDTVIAIDVIPIPAGGTQKDPSHDVVTVFESGEIICISANLEALRWVASLKSLAPSRGEEFYVEHTLLSTAKAVNQGLLRNRQDIAAILNPSLDGKSELLELTQVLCVVSRRASNRRTLGLYQVHPRSPDLPTTHVPPLKHLLTWDIPVSSSATSGVPKSLTYALHASTGSLHALTDGNFASYNFSGTVPKLTSELSMETPGTTSFLRVSQDILFTASSQHCHILDSKYNSIQATLSLGSSSTSVVRESKKRKHNESKLEAGSSIAPEMIAYYADLGQVVGIWRNDVVGFQLGGFATRKRTKTKGTRLIDSLGKGVSSHRVFMERETHIWPKWQEKMVKLDKYASKGRIAKYEELFASDIGIEFEGGAGSDKESTRPNPVNDGDDVTMVNGHTAANDNPENLPRKWRLGKPSFDSSSLKHRNYALYALSRIFHWIDSPSLDGPRGCLKIVFFPPNVFQWLLHSGYLTKESIRRAILDYSSAAIQTNLLIDDGEITRAIVDFDPELHILSAILNQRHFLPIGEVVQALKLLMQELDDQPKGEASNMLLTNGVESSTDTIEVDVASELEAASNEIDRALAILDNGISIRSDALRPTLVRLHTFPPSVISSTLRSMLLRHDLESLVRLLNHEFKNGGWASPHDSADSDASTTEPSEEADDSAVTIIASLLSCTIDAIGPANWLTAIGASSEDSSTEDLILDLSKTTSIAITGFWEARYIRGLVTELLRYASKMPKSQRPSSKALEKQGKPYALDLKPDELPMLPMGSKPDMGVERAKAGKGGKKKERSAREMGMLISRRVPKYSLEKIVI